MTRIVLPLSMPTEVIDLINKCKKKCIEEGKTWNLSKLLLPSVTATLTQFAEHFGDGNPSSNMDQFIDNPNFQVTPALFRSKEDIQKFIHSIKGTPRFDEIGEQLQTWVNIFNEADSL